MPQDRRSISDPYTDTPGATVPAFSFLWSEEDVLAGHFRLYTLSSISKVLKSSGFESKR
jgi:hypothetical protein